MEQWKKFIRDVPDFPKKGIIFKDITTLLKEGSVFKEVIDVFFKKFKDKKINKIASMESRGFIFGAALAYALGVGFVPIRKKGKLPSKTIQATYALEYGTDTLEVHQDGINKGERVLILDDVLATGGTAKAVAELVEKLGGEVVEIAFLIELSFLDGIKNINKYNVLSLLKY